MAKTKTILHFCELGKEYKVVKHYGDLNPYWIYHIYNDIGKNGYVVEHKQIMEKYCSLQSCFYWFIQHNIGY